MWGKIKYCGVKKVIYEAQKINSYKLETFMLVRK
jgi:hypothetical protein